MLSPYRRILARPGALAFSATGLYARLEIAMLSLGSVLLVQRTTGSYALAGAVAATLGVAAAVISPSIARLTDRLGQARVLRPAAVVHAVAIGALVLVAMLGAPIAVLFVAAALAGVTQVSVGSLVRARWANTVGRDDGLQVAFALESVLDEVVFIIGPVVITLIATLIHPAVGLILAAVTALSGAFLLAAQRRTEPESAASVSASAAGLEPRARSTGVLRKRGVLVLVLVFLAAGGIFGSAEVTVAAFTKQAGVPAAAGLVLALWAFGSMLSGLVYGSIRWRGGLGRRFVVAVLLMAVLTVPMVLVPTVPLLAVVFLVAGVAIAPVITAGSSLIEQLVPADRLTEGLAWTSTALSLTYAVSAAVAGLLIDAAGARAGFLVPVTAACLGAVAALIGAHRLQPRPVAGPVRA
ncbi:MFS transporter [uncultured Amnibacterium sp.]|uniref:MFS transporter n=1 Tax=uncultured Amnibacterium sp. TaxID=1631851 RepID=UPI0035C94E82